MRLRRVIYGFYAFVRAERGIAAIEFALILPIMITMVLGAAEIARYCLVLEKAQKVVMSVADMVSQSQTLTTAQLDDIMLAASQQMKPFTFEAGGLVIVSSVTQTGAPAAGNPPKVTWQVSGGGTLTGVSKIGSVGGVATLPTTFPMADQDNVITAELFYKFTPLFPAVSLVSANTLYDVTIFKPRLGALTKAPS